MKLLNNILRRKTNWIGHILRRNCVLHDALTEVIGVGRRRTQLLDDLRNRRRYWEQKKEAEDRKRWSLSTVYQSNISIFRKSLDLLISSISNNNNNCRGEDTVRMDLKEIRCLYHELGWFGSGLLWMWHRMKHHLQLLTQFMVEHSL